MTYVILHSVVISSRGCLMLATTIRASVAQLFLHRLNIVISVRSCAGVNDATAEIGNGRHLPVSVKVAPSPTHAPAGKHAVDSEPDCSRSRKRPRLLSNVSEGELC